MESTVIVALISFAGTVIGTAGGIIASGKLTQYRLNQLEKKVDSLCKSTSTIPVLEEKIGNITQRIVHIENGQNGFEYFDSCQ